MKRSILTLAVQMLALATSHADTLSYLRFEEGSGYGAYDEAGLMNGEVLNVSNVSAGGGDTGPQGWSTNVSSATVPLIGEANTGSMHFAGGSAFIDLSNANILSLGLEFTIELFMKPDMPITASPMFHFSPVSALSFMLGEDFGNLYFSSWFQSASTYDSASLVQIDEWQHFALVVDSTSYAIYLNGQVQASDSLPTGGEGPYWFSGDPTTGNRTLGDGFRGWIDEFRISDEALLPSQFLNASIPEPGTLGLLGLGFISLMTRKRLR